MNKTSSAFELSKVTIRYYYTDEDPSAPIDTFECQAAAIGATKVVGAPHAMAAPATKADHYLEIGFKSSAGDLSANGSSGDIQVRFYNAMSSPLDQTNDYSFGAANTQLADYPNITLYDMGCLVWGAEPQ